MLIGYMRVSTADPSLGLQRGIGLKVLTGDIDTTTPADHLTFNSLGLWPNSSAI